MPKKNKNYDEPDEEFLVDTDETPTELMKAFPPTKKASFIEPAEDIPTITRKIGLIVECKRAGSCCGSHKPATKYAILTVESCDGGKIWQIIDNTKLYGDYMKLIKEHGAWAGTVLSLGLHETDYFMFQIKNLKILDDSCKIVA